MAQPQRDRSKSFTSKGIALIEEAMQLKGWDKTQLAEQINVSYETVCRYLRGERPPQRTNIEIIAKQLGLNPRDLVDGWDSSVQSIKPHFDVENLVPEVRTKLAPMVIRECGTMKVLSMSQPIDIGEIYTAVNILEKQTRYRDADPLLASVSTSKELDRWGLSSVKESRVSGVECLTKYSKLMVFGKPGAGKTTFLKYLAMTCIQGENFSYLIPMFIDLKRFANSSADVNLLSFIGQKFSECNLLEEQVSCLLENGKGLILLDGLDEVKSEDSERVLMQIEDFCDRYSQNLFVITCRIAAKDYVFRNFADVEMADFDDAQIQSFAEKWFAVNDYDLTARFLKEVRANSQIKELATSPLLLTLLCLEFEESGDFPSDRADLYDRALTTLLRQWDSKRGITRDQIYKSLSIKRKESLLSHIALTTFERKEFLFKQRDLERYISDYIRNFPEVSSDPEALQLDSEVVLKSIESQHGLLVERAKRVYSFSHFTFHEFLTAKQIVNIANPYSLEDQTLQMLASHVAEKKWREVFLLTVRILPSADCLLLRVKNFIDDQIKSDEELQKFLAWVTQQSQIMEASCSKAAIRAFYFNSWKLLDSDIFLRSIYPTYELENLLGLSNIYNQSDCIGLDSEILASIYSAYNAANFPDLCFDYELGMCLNNVSSHKFISLELKHQIQFLWKQLPEFPSFNDHESLSLYNSFWAESIRFWIDDLRKVVSKYRNFAHYWNFTHEQVMALEFYYQSNILLVECLNSGCYVSREVRQEIENTLLLPIAEIEKLKGERANSA